MAQSLLSSDLTLAARIEAAEAANMLALAQALAATEPEVAFEPFAGGTAVFAGLGSPMTHAMGIGLRGPVPDEELLRMEEFFRARGSSCLIDLCPLADPSVIEFFQKRRYRVIEFNNVLARRLGADEAISPTNGVRVAQQDELMEWARVMAEGFSEFMPVTGEIVNALAGSSRNSQRWFAGFDQPVGAAALNVRGDVALFSGAAVIPSARRQGWQLALIRERLAAAYRLGCNLAVGSVLPGSGSHRNYERAGFQLIYMRINLTSD